MRRWLDDSEGLRPTLRRRVPASSGNRRRDIRASQGAINLKKPALPATDNSILVWASEIGTSVQLGSVNVGLRCNRVPGGVSYQENLIFSPPRVTDVK